MTCVEMIHDTLPEGKRDNRTVMEEYHWPYSGEGVSVGIKVLDLFIPGILVIHDPLLQPLAAQSCVAVCTGGR